LRSSTPNSDSSASFQRPLAVARPALHVQRAVQPGVAGTGLQHGAVGGLGVGPAARAEQQLAAAEVGFVAVGRRRVRGHQAVQRGQRGVGLAALFLRACQLVQHGVTVAGARVGASQAWYCVMDAR
jgi:hypothetical protein